MFGTFCFAILLESCFGDFVQPVCESLNNVYICKHAISCRWVGEEGCKNDTACFESSTNQITCKTGCTYDSDGDLYICYNATYHSPIFGGKGSCSYRHWTTNQNNHCQDQVTSCSTYGVGVCMEEGLKNDLFLNPVCESLKNDVICNYAISCQWGDSGCENDNSCFKYDGTDNISCDAGCKLDQDGDGYLCYNDTYHSNYGDKGSCSYTHWTTAQNNHCQGHGSKCATYGQGVCLESGLSNDYRERSVAFRMCVPSVLALLVLVAFAHVI